jgi:lipoate synthase
MSGMKEIETIRNTIEELKRLIPFVFLEMLVADLDATREALDALEKTLKALKKAPT